MNKQLFSSLKIPIYDALDEVLGEKIPHLRKKIWEIYGKLFAALKSRRRC